MHSSLTNKQTAKDAWDAIAAARIGSNRARRSTLQKLRQEWENLAFKTDKDIDDFALRLNTLMQQLARYGDATSTRREPSRSSSASSPRSTCGWLC